MPVVPRVHSSCRIGDAGSTAGTIGALAFPLSHANAAETAGTAPYAPEVPASAQPIVSWIEAVRLHDFFCSGQTVTVCLLTAAAPRRLYTCFIWSGRHPK